MTSFEMPVEQHLRGRPWMQTKSGRAFPLVDPEPSDVHWPDVCYGLAHNNRYAGHAGAYSVAQHSILVANALPKEYRLYGLLHDAHEAFIGDITRPVNKAIIHLANRMCGDHVAADVEDVLTDLKYGIDKAIFAKAGLNPIPSQEIREMVHVADVRTLAAEVRDLLAPAPAPWNFHEKYESLPEKIVAWDATTSFVEFGMALSRELGLTSSSM
jgi:hypothetical protein